MQLYTKHAHMYTALQKSSGQVLLRESHVNVSYPLQSHGDILKELRSSTGQCRCICRC